MKGTLSDSLCLWITDKMSKNVDLSQKCFFKYHWKELSISFQLVLAKIARKKCILTKL